MLASLVDDFWAEIWMTWMQTWGFQNISSKGSECKGKWHWNRVKSERITRTGSPRSGHVRRCKLLWRFGIVVWASYQNHILNAHKENNNWQVSQTINGMADYSTNSVFPCVAPIKLVFLFIVQIIKKIVFFSLNTRLFEILFYFFHDFYDLYFL